MSRSKIQWIERLTPVLFFGVAVLAWVLIQQTMATRLEHSMPPSPPPLLMPNPPQMTSAVILEWVAQAQRYGYQVAVTMRSFGATVWLRHPTTQQWEVMFFPLPATSPPPQELNSSF